MNITSRSRYALKIMLDMAQQGSKELVKRHDIVQRQGIPEKYLDQIMIRLRKAGLVQSVRGRLGGYQIGREPNDISMWEIFRAVEDGIYPVLCVDEQGAPCDFRHSCSANEPWQIIFGAIRRPLEDLRLSEVLMRMNSGHRSRHAEGIQECPPGRTAVAPLAAAYDKRGAIPSLPAH